MAKLSTFLFTYFILVYLVPSLGQDEEEGSTIRNLLVLDFNSLGFTVAAMTRTFAYLGLFMLFITF